MSCVCALQASDKAAQALAQFNTQLLSDERIDLSIVPVGDGMALCRKR
jgi:predicted O-methyltransferase YrrM